VKYKVPSGSQGFNLPASKEAGPKNQGGLESQTLQLVPDPTFQGFAHLVLKANRSCCRMQTTVSQELTHDTIFLHRTKQDLTQQLEVKNL
jgi:hypothetical protein